MTTREAPTSTGWAADSRGLLRTPLQALPLDYDATESGRRCWSRTPSPAPSTRSLRPNRIGVPSIQDLPIYWHGAPQPRLRPSRSSSVRSLRHIFDIGLQRTSSRISNAQCSNVKAESADGQSICSYDIAQASPTLTIAASEIELLTITPKHLEDHKYSNLQTM